jgi:hypothetical protein
MSTAAVSTRSLNQLRSFFQTRNNDAQNHAQVTLNLGANGNKQIVLNWLGATASNADSATGSTASGGVSVSA